MGLGLRLGLRASLGGGGEVVRVDDEELLARELFEPALQVVGVARPLGERVARHLVRVRVKIRVRVRVRVIRIRARVRVGVRVSARLRVRVRARIRVRVGRHHHEL